MYLCCVDTILQWKHPINTVEGVTKSSSEAPKESDILEETRKESEPTKFENLWMERIVSLGLKKCLIIFIFQSNLKQS